MLQYFQQLQQTQQISLMKSFVNKMYSVNGQYQPASQTDTTLYVQPLRN